MKIFLYEFVTGGGFLNLEGKPLPEGSLLTEGEAMWRAIYDDLTRIEGVEVYSSRDGRLSPHGHDGRVTRVDHFPRENFFGLATNCDACLLIAPEFDGIARSLAEQVELLGRPLLSPGSAFIGITADKTATANRLSQAGVRVPQGVTLDGNGTIPSDFPYPAVAKVNDGAGSMAELVESPAKLHADRLENVMRLEQFVQGTACSISFLCGGPEPPIACPPMEQILSNDGRFNYLGGKRIMCQSLIDRATALGLRTLEALPRTTGYVGVDLVLGESSDHEDVDYVIEVNPRLTTSYIGLREIATCNLAEAMLACANGKRPCTSFSDEAISFQADGTIN